MQYLKSVFIFAVIAGLLAGCSANSKQEQLAAYTKCSDQRSWQQLYNMSYRPPNDPLPVISCAKYRKGLTNEEIGRYQQQLLDEEKGSSNAEPTTEQELYRKAYGK